MSSPPSSPFRDSSSSTETKGDPILLEDDLHLLDTERLKRLNSRERTGAENGDEKALANHAYVLLSKVKEMRKKLEEKLRKKDEQEAYNAKLNAEHSRLDVEFAQLEQIRRDMEEEHNMMKVQHAERKTLRSRTARQWEAGSDDRQELMQSIEEWVHSYHGY